MIKIEEGESLADYAKRIAEKLKELELELRQRDQRYDLERHITERVVAMGLPVCETAYALNVDVTPNHFAHVIEHHALAGMQLRLHAEYTSLGEVSYADVAHFRAGDARAADASLMEVVRRLMIAMRSDAQKWLDANPADDAPTATVECSLELEGHSLTFVAPFGQLNATITGPVSNARALLLGAATALSARPGGGE